jgi:hypothetical protein
MEFLDKVAASNFKYKRVIYSKKSLAGDGPNVVNEKEVYNETIVRVSQ